jgi:hypothetical protein
MIAGIGFAPIPFYTDRWHSSDMSTQTDPPCSATDRAAIVAAARYRAGFIRWLSTLLASPRWERMAPQAQDTIRAEVRLVLEQMTEGCS